MDQSSQYCRLCFTAITNDVFNVFDKISENCSIVYLISIYFSIEITDHDNFSKTVCNFCAAKLKDFHEFTLFVKRNNDSLSFLGNNMPLKEETTEHEECKQTTEGVCETEYSKAEEIGAEECEENLVNFCEAQLGDVNELSTNCEKLEAENVSAKNVPTTNIEKKSCPETKTRKRKRGKPKIPMKSEAEARNDETIKQFNKFECEICKEDLGISSFRLLKIHFKTMHGSKAFLKCCGKKFSRGDLLVAHINEHLNPESLVCPKCDKKCSTKQTLILHMDRHKPASERPFKCRYCGAGFIRNCYLVQHEQSHLSEYLKCECQTCGKKFLHNSALRQHINNTHSTEKPYVCEICAKAFKLNVHLQRHSFVHKNIFKDCEICGLKLKYPKSYMTHMKSKHDESAPKSYPCTNCHHVSPTKSALYAHNLNVHGPKKHKCSYCGDAFATNNLLKCHLTKHTGPGEPIKCPHCPKVFRFRSGYYSHKKRVHPLE